MINSSNPGLGSTFAVLSALRRGRPFPAPSARPGFNGRLVEAQGFDNPGALRMLTYTPPGIDPGAPLVVVLHGCTQTAEAYAAGAGWISLADRYGFALLCPEQTQANNANRCFNWFQPGDVRAGAGEVASIRAMVEHRIADGDIDPTRVYVSGLSAGGAMAAAMLATYPEMFAGGAIVAGLPYGAASSVGEAFTAMFQPSDESWEFRGDAVRDAGAHTGPWPRVSVWHGDADTTVRPGNGDELVKQWADLHGLPLAPSEVERFPTRERRVWTGPDGRVLVEQHVLTGLNHGTPLAAEGPDGHGTAGPFLLEAGVSSSLETLRFWGLVDEAAARVRQSESPTPAPVSPAGAARPRARTPEPALAAKVLPAKVAHGVQAVIERALTAAGLMR